jgi:hypothetical protein
MGEVFDGEVSFLLLPRKTAHQLEKDVSLQSYLCNRLNNLLYISSKSLFMVLCLQQERILLVKEGV